MRCSRTNNKFYLILAEQEKEVDESEEQIEEVKQAEDEQVLEQEEEEEEAVQIIQPLQDFNTKKGQTARFTCEITGGS